MPALALAVLLALPAAAAAPPRVFLIGIDGASWDVLERLFAEGRLPNLRRLLRSGRRGVLTPVEPLISPVIWTSIATGRLPKDHGITDFVWNGRRELTRKDRKVDAVWNLLSGHGDRVGVVGYMATWPADPVKGFIVSDKLFHPGPRHLEGGELEGAAYPENLLDGLIDQRRCIEGPHEALSSLRRLMPGLYWNPDYKSLPSGSAEYRRHDRLKYTVYEPFSQDQCWVRLAELLLPRQRPDFFAIHLWLVDHASHAFWRPYMGPYDKRDIAPDPQDRLLAATAIPAAYILADLYLGRLLRHADRTTTVLVVSDHGFTHNRSGQAQTGTHSREGVLIAQGAGILAHGKPVQASVLDIAPTILHLRRRPIPKEMSGRILTELLDSRMARGRPLLRAGPGVRVAPASGGEPGIPLDPAVRDHLKAMGYLK